MIAMASLNGAWPVEEQTGGTSHQFSAGTAGRLRHLLVVVSLHKKASVRGTYIKPPADHRKLSFEQSSYLVAVSLGASVCGLLCCCLALLRRALSYSAARANLRLDASTIVIRGPLSIGHTNWTSSCSQMTPQSELSCKVHSVTIYNK